MLQRSATGKIKFVCIADTHGRHHHIRLPLADVLVHAGDCTFRGKTSETRFFLEWLGRQPYPYKILVAGNHDFFFEKEKPEVIRKMLPEDVIYLNDSGCEIGGIRIWGSPVTPQFFNWAFNRKRGAAIREHWNRIPEQTDLLITHGPPLGILDQTVREQPVGCRDLLEVVTRIRPRFHVFGHIHEGYGTARRNGTQFINCSVMNENYDLVHKPQVFEIKL